MLICIKLLFSPLLHYGNVVCWLFLGIAVKNEFIQCSRSVSTIDRNPFDGYNLIPPGCQSSQGNIYIFSDRISMWWRGLLYEMLLNDCYTCHCTLVRLQPNIRSDVLSPWLILCCTHVPFLPRPRAMHHFKCVFHPIRAPKTYVRDDEAPHLLPLFGHEARTDVGWGSEEWWARPKDERVDGNQQRQRKKGLRFVSCIIKLFSVHSTVDSSLAKGGWWFTFYETVDI